MQRRMTLWSVVGFLPLWVWYSVVPQPLRFLWWLVWVRVAAAHHVVHRRAVKLGAAPALPALRSALS